MICHDILLNGGGGRKLFKGALSNNVPKLPKLPASLKLKKKGPPNGCPFFYSWAQLERSGLFGIALSNHVSRRHRAISSVQKAHKPELLICQKLIACGKDQDTEGANLDRCVSWTISVVAIIIDAYFIGHVFQVGVTDILGARTAKIIDIKGRRAAGHLPVRGFIAVIAIPSVGVISPSICIGVQIMQIDIVVLNAVGGPGQD